MSEWAKERQEEFEKFLEEQIDTIQAVYAQVYKNAVDFHEKRCCATNPVEKKECQGDFMKLFIIVYDREMQSRKLKYKIDKFRSN